MVKYEPDILVPVLCQEVDRTSVTVLGPLVSDMFDRDVKGNFINGKQAACLAFKDNSYAVPAEESERNKYILYDRFCANEAPNGLLGPILTEIRAEIIGLVARPYLNNDYLNWRFHVIIQAPDGGPAIHVNHVKLRDNESRGAAAAAAAAAAAVPGMAKASKIAVKKVKAAAARIRAGAIKKTANNKRPHAKPRGKASASQAGRKAGRKAGQAAAPTPAVAVSPNAPMVAEAAASQSLEGVFDYSDPAAADADFRQYTPFLAELLGLDSAEGDTPMGDRSFSFSFSDEPLRAGDVNGPDFVTNKDLFELEDVMALLLTESLS